MKKIQSEPEPKLDEKFYSNFKESVKEQAATSTVTSETPMGDVTPGATGDNPVSQLMQEQYVPECVICKKVVRQYMVYPCGHICLCEKCATKFKNKIDNDKRFDCPVCKNQA